MTILEASNHLVAFFSKNDIFELGRDFNKIVLISDDDGDKAVILSSLDDLEKRELVIKKHFNTLDYWCLRRPLEFENQALLVPLSVAIEVSSFLNNAAPKNDTRSNPLSLTAEDIVNLLVLAKSN